MATQGRRHSKRSPAARPTAPRPSRAATAHAGRPQTNSRELATRVARLPRPRKNCTAHKNCVADPVSWTWDRLSPLTRPSMSKSFGIIRCNLSSTRNLRAGSTHFAVSRAILSPLHLANFVGLGATWGLNLYGGALCLADQRPRGG